MNTYQNIFNALRNPAMASIIDTPANPQDWKRFFGMMDTLESAEIAQFKSGRYGLHPKQQANVLAQAEAVLASMSVSLALPLVEAEVIAPVESIAQVFPEFNTCPRCHGQKRVKIADALGHFGSFPCLPCGATGQIAVPPRSSFPPVSLAKPPTSPESLGLSYPKPVVIPQAVEVSHVRVIVHAPAPILAVVEALAPVIAEKALDCEACDGYGTIIKNCKEQTCATCDGTGEKAVVEAVVESLIWLDDDTQQLPVIDSPSDELLAELAPLAELATSNEATPILSPIVSEPEIDLIIAAPPVTSPSTAEIIAAELANIAAFETDWAAAEVNEAVLKMPVAIIAYAPKTRFVRVNWTGRGFSSGKSELIKIVRKHGRTRYVVNMTVGNKAYQREVKPADCEMVVS